MAPAPKRVKVRKLITLKTSDIKLDKIKKQLNKQLKPTLGLGVGFFDTATYPNGKKVAQVAHDNEYGFGKVLPRPFFRTTIDEKSKEWGALIASEQVKNKDMFKTLNVVGTIASNDIADSIINLSSPANAESTIQKKGSSNPLVDSTLMSRSVTHEITGG